MFVSVENRKLKIQSEFPLAKKKKKKRHTQPKLINTC